MLIAVHIGMILRWECMLFIEQKIFMWKSLEKTKKNKNINEKKGKRNKQTKNKKTNKNKKKK